MISTNLKFLLMPSIIFMIGGFISCFLKDKIRTAFSLSIPLISFYCLNKYLLNITGLNYYFLGFNLDLFVYDQQSLFFSYIFHFFAFIALIYASFTKKSIEIGAALFYVGASLGVVFSGDFFSFYIFWELLTFGAAIFIYLGNENESKNASFRYLIFHLIGGLVLLSGILLYYKETGLLVIRELKLNSLYSYLIFLGFGVNAGFPFLHTWITDSYHRASVVGGVFLSSLTTKVAIYALIRCFVGTQALIYIGLIMVIFPVFYAVIESNLRKVLSYSLINQLGFMLVGIGIGTTLSLNGTFSHVFVHILYKSLLFMVTGAILYQYNTCNADKLSYLYKKMPLVCICGVIASLSIAAFPMFSGFVTKSMIISAALDEHLIFVWVVLLVGSAAVVKYIKVPFCAFFTKGKNADLVKLSCVNQIPFCMKFSMVLVATSCVVIGVFPDLLYSILPFNIYNEEIVKSSCLLGGCERNYSPYTYFHILSQLEILFFAGLSLFICHKFRLYPKEDSKITVDVDFYYRKFFYCADKFFCNTFNALNTFFNDLLLKLGRALFYEFTTFSQKYTEKKYAVGITLSFIVLIFFILCSF